MYSHYCTIKNISEDLYKSFIENNYIKNYKPAEVRIGLYYNDELIECLGISKSKEYEWEIVSNCSKIGYKIIDGFSSLINYFKNNYTGSIITFVDSRYFNTSEYNENGFKFIEHSKPKCYYFDSLIRKGLDKLFESVKEIENTFVVYNQNSDKKDLIYLRIYDAGYDVLVLE